MFRILACVQKKHKTTACSVLFLQEGHGMRPDRILMWYILRSDLFLWNRWYIQHLVPLLVFIEAGHGDQYEAVAGDSEEKDILAQL